MLSRYLNVLQPCPHNPCLVVGRSPYLTWVMEPGTVSACGTRRVLQSVVDSVSEGLLTRRLGCSPGVAGPPGVAWETQLHLWAVGLRTAH